VCLHPRCRLVNEAKAIGFPLLVKAVSGGGGKGMKMAYSLVSSCPAAEVAADEFSPLQWGRA
jgi:acetyl/propionyl-CoA carboxylase alpha subunit